MRKRGVNFRSVLKNLSELTLGVESFIENPDKEVYQSEEKVIVNIKEDIIKDINGFTIQSRQNSYKDEEWKSSLVFISIPLVAQTYLMTNGEMPFFDFDSYLLLSLANLAITLAICVALISSIAGLLSKKVVYPTDYRQYFEPDFDFNQDYEYYLDTKFGTQESIISELKRVTDRIRMTNRITLVSIFLAIGFLLIKVVI